MAVEAEDLFDAIEAGMESAWRAGVREIQADVVQRIGVPVERIGGRTIRSLPGEPPRRDTGALQDSIQADVAASSSQLEAAVSTDKAYAPRLIEMSRLLITDKADEYEDIMLDATVRAISEE